LTYFFDFKYFFIYFKLINLILLDKSAYWGLGIGDWGLGVGGWGPTPKPPTPKPQTPNPK